MTSVSNARKLATWHDTVPISDVLTVTTMDMLPWISLIKYYPQVHQHATGTIPPADVTDHHLGIIATPDIPTMIIGIDTGLIILAPTHITLDTGVTVAKTPTEVAPDHFIGHHVVALHATGAQAHITTTVTHHIVDPHHMEISPEMTVDPDLDHKNPASTTTNPHKGNPPVHSQHPGNLRIEGTNRLQLMTHPQSITALMNKTVIQRMI